MLPALPRKTWFLLLPAALMLVAVGYGVGGGSAARSGLAGFTTASPPPVAASAALPEAIAIERVRERPVAVGPGLPLDLRAAFEGDTDLYEYARQLRLAGEAGNAEARWMASRVYDYCAAYAMDPAGYALDNGMLAALGLEAAPGLVAARERVGHRCAGFVAADGLGRALVMSQRKLAAEGGNLAAEASLLAQGEPLQDDADYRRGLVERVLESQDPEAFLALSPAMGAAASSDDAYQGLVAGNRFAELAWQMAACELGLACGPDSVLMNSYCANGGICSQDPGQDFISFVFDAAVPRQGAEKMNELVKRLRGGRGGR